MKKKLLIFAAIVIVIGGIVFQNIRQNKVQRTEVQTQEITHREIVEKVSASGRIQPVTQINISANVSAEIISMHVEEGDRVKQGQLLFQLDKVRYDADVRSYESLYNSRKASLDKSAKDMQRFEGLFRSNNVSLAELEDIQTQYQLAKSSLEQSEAGLKQARDNLDKTTVRSPMSGTVIAVYKEAGEIALGSQFSQDVVMIIADLSKMEVEVEVNENDVVRVSRKDRVDIEVDAIPDTVFRGEVSEIAHLASSSGLGTQNAVTNFTVVVTMLEVPEQMRPGMSATVEIETSRRENAVAVPIQCVTIRSEDQLRPKKASGDRPAGLMAEDSSAEVLEDMPVVKQQMLEVVFVVQGDSVVARPVQLGISSDDYFEILSGLEAGETVVEGPHRVLSRELQTGSKVEDSKDKGKDKKGFGPKAG